MLSFLKSQQQHMAFNFRKQGLSLVQTSGMSDVWQPRPGRLKVVERSQPTAARMGTGLCSLIVMQDRKPADRRHLSWDRGVLDSKFREGCRNCGRRTRSRNDSRSGGSPRQPQHRASQNPSLSDAVGEVRSPQHAYLLKPPCP